MPSKLDNFKIYLNDTELSHSSKNNYYITIRKFLRDYGKINLETAKQFINDAVAPGNRNKRITAIKNYCDFDGKQAWYKELKRKKEPIKPHGLFSDEEIVRVLNRFDYLSRDYIIIALLAYTAARPSEVVGLKTRDVNIVEHTVIFWDTKNGENRKIIIPKIIRSDVEKYAQSIDTDWMFPSMKNEIRHKNTHVGVLDIRKTFYKKLDEIGITKEQRNARDLKFYHLKHSCITRLKKGGVDIVEMKSITGHKKLDSLLHYYQGDLEMMDKNFDKDRMSKMSLTAQEAFNQIVESVQKLHREVKLFNQLNSSLSEDDGEIVLRVKMKN